MSLYQATRAQARFGCLLSAFAACALASSSGRAENPSAACTSAFEEGQLLRQESRYVEALQRSAICAKPTCGAAISRECSRLYVALQAEVPTVVLAAHDAEQNDLTGVRVFVDGVLVREKLDGSPLPVDPGTHVFRFEVPSGPSIERSHSVKAGQKLRIISETLGEQPTKASAPKGPTSAPSQGAAESPSPSPAALRVGGFVTAGVGALAFVGFGVFRWLAFQDYDHLTATCIGGCTRSDVDAVQRNFTASNALLGVGIAATGTAATLFLWSIAKHDTSARVGVVPQAGGGAISFSGQF